MKKYWASGAELMSLLANEEIYATVAWSGRVASLQQEGHPIGYLSPKGTYSWMEYLSSSKAPIWKSPRSCSISCWSRPRPSPWPRAELSAQPGSVQGGVDRKN
jgi:hypothetical protein